MSDERISSLQINLELIIQINDDKTIIRKNDEIANEIINQIMVEINDETIILEIEIEVSQLKISNYENGMTDILNCNITTECLSL